MTELLMIVEMVNPYYVAAFVAVLGPLITYFIAVRNLSGRIDTSSATDLWTESRSLREEYRMQISTLQQRLVQLELRAVALQKHIEECDKHNEELLKKMEKLEHV
jgi:hypothetical protein